ncbi:unnamed protein product [Lampetra planeri]
MGLHIPRAQGHPRLLVEPNLGPSGSEAGGRAMSSMPRDILQHHQEVRRRGEATVDGEQQIAGFNEQSVVEKILKVRDCPWLENRTEIDAFQ